MKCYQIINWIAVLGHLVASISFMYVYLSRTNLEIGYTETYLKWVKINGKEFNGVLMNTSDACKLLNPPGRNLSTANNGDFCIVATTSGGIGGLDLGWLIISFHLLSFFFQALAGLTDVCCTNGIVVGDFKYKYSYMIEVEGRNPLRFIEYSISASIMLICIAFLNGVTDINLIASIAVLTACCQLCGLVVEYIPDEQLSLQYILHFTGWIQFLCAYGIISHAFFKSVDAVADVRPPDFVYVIVFTLFVLYASFGIVQLSELSCKTRSILGSKELTGCDRCPRWCRNENNRAINKEYKEILYVSLSLGAKLVLGLLIFTNVLFSTREE